MSNTPEDWLALREEEPVNIFMLDHDPVAAAAAHCDKHVVKMILETAQLLSTAWHRLHNPMFFGSEEKVTYAGLIERVVPPALYRTPELTGLSKDGGVSTGDKPFYLLLGQRIYGDTHANHPSAVWSREYGGNYVWLWRLGMALLDEYTRRYGKVHKTAAVMWTLESVPPALLPTVKTWTEATPAMPDECKVIADGFYDSVASYRKYYVDKKQALLFWKTQPPNWVTYKGTAYELS